MFPCFFAPGSWLGHAQKQGFNEWFSCQRVWWRELETHLYQQVGRQFSTALNKVGEIRIRLRIVIPERNLFLCHHWWLMTFLTTSGLFGDTALCGYSCPDLVHFCCYDTSACLRGWGPVILPLMSFVPLMCQYSNHSLVEPLKIRGLEPAFSTLSSNSVQGQWHEEAQQFL